MGKNIFDIQIRYWQVKISSKSHFRFGKRKYHSFSLIKFLIKKFDNLAKICYNSDKKKEGEKNKY